MNTNNDTENLQSPLSAKNAERERIGKEVKKFLCGGGEIKKIARNTTVDEVRVVLARNDLSTINRQIIVKKIRSKKGNQ